MIKKILISLILVSSVIYANWSVKAMKDEFGDFSYYGAYAKSDDGVLEVSIGKDGEIILSAPDLKIIYNTVVFKFDDGEIIRSKFKSGENYYTLYKKNALIYNKIMDSNSMRILIEEYKGSKIIFKVNNANSIKARSEMIEKNDDI